MNANMFRWTGPQTATWRSREQFQAELLLRVDVALYWPILFSVAEKMTYVSDLHECTVFTYILLPLLHNNAVSAVIC